MVKVQKPNPKSLKKNVPEKAKNVQIKKSKLNATKEKVKAIENTLENVGKKKVAKDIKPKSDVLNKNSKKVLQKEQDTVQKKKPTVVKVEKKSPSVEKKVVQKKQPAVTKVESKSQTIEIKKNLKKTQTQNVEEDTNKISSAPIFEPSNFNEEQFKTIVSLGNIKKISKALKTIVEKEVSEKKTSIFSDYKYFLNVSSYKIPNCPKRMIKLNVKHSLVDTKNDDVVIIVPDLQRGAKVDYEPTIQHYEDLLRENGVDNIKVVPLNQLRNECTTYEAKRKFANTYDYFLCDGRIVGHVVGFCGKHFQKPRSTIHAVRLDNPKTYKSDIQHALKRTSYKQLHKGDLVSLPVGNHRFTTNQVAENIEMAIDQLKTLFPGGYANIRNIYIKIDIKGTSSLPLYVNLVGAPQETPNVIGPREQRMLKLKKQANEILTKFNMSKTGEFIKLNKTQVKRKQQIRESETALLSKEPVDEERVSESKPPAKKAKRDKQTEIESKSDDENKDSDDNECSDEDEN